MRTDDILAAIVDAKMRSEEPQAIMVHPSDIMELMRDEHYIPETNYGSSTFQTGGLGSIFGLKVITSVRCKEGIIIILTDKGLFESKGEWNPSARG